MMQPEAVVMGFSPPPISGMSTTGGVEAYLQMRGSGTLQDLEAAANKFVQGGDKHKRGRHAQVPGNRHNPEFVFDRRAPAALRQS